MNCQMGVMGIFLMSKRLKSSKATSMHLFVDGLVLSAVKILANGHQLSAAELYREKIIRD